MRRYWLQIPDADVSEFLIEGDTFHHIFEVCRQGVGSGFEILNAGKAYFVRVESVGKKSAQVRVIEKRNISALPSPFVHLCVSLPKFSTWELIIEKAVELGTFELHPFVSDFSFLKDIRSEKLKNKKQRWERIVTSATQQSGRGDLMKILPLTTLQDLLEKMNQTPLSVGLFPYEGESEQTVKTAIAEMKLETPEHIWIFVGSEGGFSDSEVAFLKEQGLKTSSLGEQVLRVETACLSLVSIVKYEFAKEREFRSNK